MDKITPKHYFMVGIGGIGMQALADLLLGMGHRVTGSNVTDFVERERLKVKGIKVIIGEHKAENLPPETDELIYTSAIKAYFSPVETHPELARAIELGVPIIQRSVFIGKLMMGKVGIAVAGTHGKTTTTTLITLILQKAGLEPSALIGAEVKSLSGAGIYGDGEQIVVEACEYDRSFLDMKPTIAVVTNIEADHLDYYKNLNEIKQAFREFILLVPQNGLVVVCGDDANVREVLPSAKSKVITFGFDKSNDIQAKIITPNDDKTQFKIGDQIFALKLPGKHLILDALAAIVVVRHIGVQDDVIKTVLANFGGAKRRFEILGDVKGVTFVDDYAHHPTEIQALLISAREFFAGRKIRVVFQAHQYSRTRLLINDFGKSFTNTDEVLVVPILPVRDSVEDLEAIATSDLVDKINAVSGNAKLFDDFDAISEYLKTNLQSGDIVLSVGAGKNSDWINDFYRQFSLNWGR